MSEDWLVISERSIGLEDLLRALQGWGGDTCVRVDASGVCTVLVDGQDRTLLWVGPSTWVRDAKQASIRCGSAPSNHTQCWWTELVQPARLHTGLGERVEVAAFAHALAVAAGGSAQRLSRAPSPEGSAGDVCLPGVDVACDVLTESCAIFVQTRPVLALTAWVDLAMTWALQRALVPVFLTPGSTHLSRVLHHYAERGGCLWIRQGPEGMHNGATGHPVAWDGTRFAGSQAQPWQPAGSGGWEIMIDGEALHPLGPDLRIGGYVEAVHDAAGIDRPQSWGLVEPCDRAWDRGAIATQAGSVDTTGSRFLLSSEIGDGVATIAPGLRGTRESLTWVGDAEGLLPTQTNLVRLGERLLSAGSEVCVVGYRRPTVPEPGHVGGVGAVLPGLICFAPCRFEGLDPSILQLDTESGVLVHTTDLGTVITFGAHGQPSDASSAALITAWDAILGELAARDWWVEPVGEPVSAESKGSGRGLYV